jgi:hypothetical protein
LRPKPRPKYNARKAKAKIEKLHASKVRFLTGFKTATHYRGGKLRPEPQAFPTGSMAGKKLPKLRFKKPTRKEKERLTKLEREAFREEERLKAAGFKAWVIGVKYKDGSTEEIPIIAKTYTEALKKAKPKMNQLQSQIDEITIIDPSIGEILHKVGAGAAKAARKIGRGLMKAPARIEKLGLRAARKLGRIWAQPEQMREAFEAAKKERPWLTPEQFAAETGITRLREAEVGVPQISAPGIQYPPSERERLSAETAETLRREARETAEVRGIRLQRARINGRSWKPFGIPLIEYQSGGSAAPAAEREAQPSRVGAARRKAAWTERAPVKIER